MHATRSAHALPWLALTISLTLIGCVNDPPPPAPLPVAAQAQPRYATADELVAHINVLIARNPIDQAGLDALFYAENDLQRRIERVVRNLRPFEQLEHKLFERFGAGLMGVRASPLAPMAPAEIIERSPQRALALTAMADGEPLHLYLVQIGEGWWISGYTLERLLESSGQTEFLTAFRDEGQQFAEIARSFSSRVDRGEFRTIEQARTAWRAHILSQ